MFLFPELCSGMSPATVCLAATINKPQPIRNKSQYQTDFLRHLKSCFYKTLVQPQRNNNNQFQHNIKTKAIGPVADL